MVALLTAEGVDMRDTQEALPETAAMRAADDPPLARRALQLPGGARVPPPCERERVIEHSRPLWHGPW
jgi:hypothetical protein